MNIGISTFGCDGGKSGIGQYVIDLLREFSSLREPSMQIEVFVHKSEKNIYLSDSSSLSAIVYDDKLQNKLLNLSWHQLILPIMSKNKHYDVLFLPSANRRLPFYVPCPTVGTVHDLYAMNIPNKYGRLRSVYNKHIIPILIRRLTRVISVSEKTKNDIIESTGIPDDRICVIPHGVDNRRYYPRNKDSRIMDTCEKYGIRFPYILYVSRIDHPGKNHIRLIRAFEQLKAIEHIPHLLLLVGVDWNRGEEVHEVAERSRYCSEIVFTGFIPDDELPDLYCGADLFICPSLFEGFGMPLLEAMACGIPIACSNAGSLPEVLGKAGLLFDPYDVNAIAEKIKCLLSNDDLRNYYVEKGLKRSKKFTWAVTASKTLDVIAEAAAEGRRAPT